MDAKISSSFWSDPDLVKLAPQDQPYVRYTILWMITNPDTNLCGIFRIAPRLFAFQTGLEEHWLERTLELLPKMFLRDGEDVLLRNFVRYQFGGGQGLTRSNVVKALLKGLARGSQALHKGFLDIYPELKPLWRAYQGASEPMLPGVAAPEIDLTHPSEKEAPCKPLASPLQGTRAEKSREEKYRGSAEGEAVIPTEEELLAFAAISGIPPEYARKYHRWRTNSGLWLNFRKELLLWKKDLMERWADERATWKPEKSAAAAADIEDLKAQLQTETDPDKRRELRQRLRPV